jgi:hypothetical protein
MDSFRDRGVFFGAAALFGATLFGAALFGAALFGAALFGAALFGAALFGAALAPNMLLNDSSAATFSVMCLDGYNLDNSLFTSRRWDNVSVFFDFFLEDAVVLVLVALVAVWASSSLSVVASLSGDGGCGPGPFKLLLYVRAASSCFLVGFVGFLVLDGMVERVTGIGLIVLITTLRWDVFIFQFLFSIFF